jgi:hypothetical protein
MPLYVTLEHWLRERPPDPLPLCGLARALPSDYRAGAVLLHLIWTAGDRAAHGPERQTFCGYGFRSAGQGSTWDLREVQAVEAAPDTEVCPGCLRRFRRLRRLP